MSLFVKLALSFFKIGLLGYGGGLAIIALIKDSVLYFTGISAEEFANMVAITQVTPGPIAINMATFVGFKSAGILGSIVATLGVAIPAFVLVSITCRILFRYMDSWGVKGALTGIKPATVGMIGTALVMLTGPAIFTTSHLGAGAASALGGGFGRMGEWLAATPVDVISMVIIAATILLIQKFKIDPIKVLVIMGVVGMVLQA